MVEVKNTGRDKMVLAWALMFQTINLGTSLLVWWIRRMKTPCRSRKRLFKMWWNQSRRNAALPLKWSAFSAMERTLPGDLRKRRSALQRAYLKSGRHGSLPQLWPLQACRLGSVRAESKRKHGYLPLPVAHDPRFLNVPQSAQRSV